MASRDRSDGEPPGTAAANGGEGIGAGQGDGTGNHGQSDSILQGSIFASPNAKGYNADSSTAGTLIDVPNLDVPSSIDVITEDVRQDQQALQIDDLLRDIGGAVKIGNQQYPDAFFLRGFEIRARDYRKNGFLDPTYTPRDFADVERIEILKGPASVLYGAGQPSGVVNLITKKPLDAPMYQGGIQFGSFGLERYTIDATGPMNAGKSLLYRINAAYEDEGSFRDFGYAERTFVSPSITWVIDGNTMLNWEGEYVNDRRRLDTGVAAINNDAAALPINRFLGEPSNDTQHYTDYRQTLMLTHRINEDWAWNFGGYSVFYGGPSSATYPVAYVDGAIGPLGQDVFFRSRQNIDPFQEQYHSAIANISGKFSGDTVTHNVVLGDRTRLARLERLPRRPVDPQTRSIQPRGWLSTASIRSTTIPTSACPTPPRRFRSIRPVLRESPRRLHSRPDRHRRALESVDRRALRSRRYDVRPRNRHPAVLRSIGAKPYKRSTTARRAWAWCISPSPRSSRTTRCTAIRSTRPAADPS